MDNSMTATKWLEHFEVSDALAIRRLTEREASAWLTTKYPEATPEALVEALKLAKPNEKDSERVHVYIAEAKVPYMDELCTSMYMLGGTLSQIGKLIGVSRSAIFNRVVKVIPEAEVRLKQRRSYRVPQEALDILYQRHLTAVRHNLMILDGMTIFQIIDFMEKQLEINI